MTYHEQKMFEEFKRHYPDQSESHKTTYEWLTLMQHYGLSTRLLDWSSNLLVGLYFCCINDQENDGALFICDPTMDCMYKFSELLEMQVQEKSRSDFFHRIIYKLDSVVEEGCKLNGIAIEELRNNMFNCSQFTGLSTGSSANFDSLEIKTNLPNTQDLNGNVIPHVFSRYKACFFKYSSL